MLTSLARPAWVAVGVAAQAAFLAFLPLFWWFLDTGASAAAPPGSPVLLPALADAALVALFAVPHSILLWPPVRRWLVRFVPQQLFGSVFCLASVASLLLVFALWQPLPGAVWDLSGRGLVVMRAANGLAWVALAYSMSLNGLGYQTGLTSLVRYVRRIPEPRPAFAPRGAYHVLRHPIYLSFLLVSWTTPRMGMAHLIASVGFTLYALIGSVLKDRRLAAIVGEPYRDYMARVTGFPLVPAGPLSRVPRTVASLLLVLALPLVARAGERRTFPLGPAAGELTIEVKKRGALKAFAHDHTVAAPIATGTFTWVADDPARSSVALEVDARKLRVLDPDFSEEDRATVQKNMENDVLEVAKFPSITFASTSVVPLDPDGQPGRLFSVVGKITLHGTTRPAMIKVRVTERDGALVVKGEHALKQSDHGIEPYSAALGTVGVQDVVMVRFDLVVQPGGGK